MTSAPIYLDATMMYRWRHLAPVGIVRLERLIASHLRYVADLGQVEYVLWDNGYRHADEPERTVLDRLLDPAATSTDAGSQVAPTTASVDGVQPEPAPDRARGAVAATRRTALRAIGRLPEHLRPFAEQAAWSAATLAVESARHVKRRRTERGGPVARKPKASSVQHRIDLEAGGDLIALGLGWEYIDHEAMYSLAHDHGFRIHMPAFDLIPVTMPQMNAGQSHLVHRYYAEMAHYADSITSISHATTDALRRFYLDEGLPVPYLATNQLPGLDLPAPAEATTDRRRHRLEGERFVLSVSTVEIRKNHLLLAKIWTESIRDGIDLPKLVIVGRLGWDITELLRWLHNAPELTDSVVVYTDVEDDELVHLYSDALFTVFPSRIEGWGLPITEALTYGKVCIHSDDPAQVEAGQGLMPALHPDDFIAWKHEIVRMSSETEYRAELEALIAARYVRRTSADYVADFERVIAARRMGRP